MKHCHTQDQEIDQERTAAAAFHFPDGRAANTIIYYEEGYVPKHMKQYDDAFDHCCFAGCQRMDEYGCCANMGWHKAGCPLNPFREYDEQDHAFYVSQGLRKHLRTA